MNSVDKLMCAVVTAPSHPVAVLFVASVGMSHAIPHLTFRSNLPTPQAAISSPSLDTFPHTLACLSLPRISHGQAGRIAKEHRVRAVRAIEPDGPVLASLRLFLVPDKALTPLDTPEGSRPALSRT